MQVWQLVLLVIAFLLLLSIIGIILWWIIVYRWLWLTRKELTSSLKAIASSLGFQSETIKKLKIFLAGKCNDIGLPDNAADIPSDIDGLVRLSLTLAAFSQQADKIIADCPELGKTEGFQRLYSELSAVRERTTAARRLYNSLVSRYNTKLLVFPSHILARYYHLSAEPFFGTDKAN